jgi:hypothetical protein
MQTKGKVGRRDFLRALGGGEVLRSLRPGHSSNKQRPTASLTMRNGRRATKRTRRTFRPTTA